MKLLVTILVALLIIVVGTLAAIEDNGYVLIARTPWSIELPLTLFLLLLLLTIVGLYVASYIGIHTWMIPETINNWRTGRKAKRARRSLNEGLLQLAEGDWLQAETHLLSQLHYSDMPLINYLGAAYAAQHRGDTEKRDEYLSEAQKQTEDHNLAIAYTQAQLQQMARQPELALATLTELREKSPKHGFSSVLLAYTYLALKDWASLAAVLAEIRKQKRLPEPELNELEIEAHEQLLRLPVPAGSAYVLQHAWEAVPKQHRNNNRLLCTYAAGLVKNDQHDEAEKILRRAIESEWDECLLLQFSVVRSSDLEKQINLCKHWEQEHPDSAALQLCLGQLNQAKGYLDTATKYFQKAINLNPSRKGYAALGNALEQQGHTSQAMEAYRDGLELTR
ncbi:MAG: hypothetical protein IME93_05500 [Proteobacteria bacterium]|nr:hypothetical protein [Pseudomonadota bacterium]